MYFNIDVVLKAGCIERAIVSAGGPSISCQGMGLGKRKRELPELSNQTMTINGGPGIPAPYSDEEIAEFQSFYENAFPNSSTHAAYVPMDWPKESSSVGLSTTSDIIYVTVYVDPS